MLYLERVGTVVRSVMLSKGALRINGWSRGVLTTRRRCGDAISGRELLTLTGHTGAVHSVAWSPYGKQLATGSRDHTAKMWDAASGKELLTLIGDNGDVWSVAWSPDGKRLATANGDHTAKVWDAANRQ